MPRPQVVLLRALHVGDMMSGQIFEMCGHSQGNAISDKIKVGAVCHGQKIVNGKIHHKYFSGSNIHISDSFADIHAEQIAVNLSLLEKYYPTEIYVTSQSVKENVTMCGSCRHYISEINCHCIIIIFNPDGTRKSTNFLSDIYPYSKDTVPKNDRFKKLCGETYK